MKKQSNKKKLGGKDLLCIYFEGSIYQWVSQGRNVRKKLEAETVEKHCFLSGFLVQDQLVFLDSPEQRMEVSCSPQRVVSPTSSSVKTIPHRHGHKPIWLRQLLGWAPFFQLTLGCIKWTKITNQSNNWSHFNTKKCFEIKTNGAPRQVDYTSTQRDSCFIF